MTITVLLIVKQMTVKDSIDCIVSSAQKSEQTEKPLISASDIQFSDIPEEVVTQSRAQTSSTAQTSTTTLSTTTIITTTEGTTPTTLTTLGTTSSKELTSTTTPTPSTIIKLITTERTTPKTTTTTMGTTASTTTLKPTTTLRTTTTTTTPLPKIVDHFLATIVINSATVPNKDGFTDYTDAYVKAYIDYRYIGETPIAKNTLNPHWNYQIAYKTKLKPDSVIMFKLYDHDRFTDHDWIGSFTVKISELRDSGSNGSKVNRSHGSGRLWFTVTWDEVYRTY